jgi:hypothetical protein
MHSTSTCRTFWVSLLLSAAFAGATMAQTDASGAVAKEPTTDVAPVPPEGCRPLTDKAMSADMKALTAQSQKVELSDQARFYATSVALWAQAAEQCEGRAKDRALRNLADSQKISSGLTEQISSGPQCAAAHKDGLSLQELAVQALSERRWSDASVLFRKAEDTWDLAVERCTGNQSEVATRRRDQSEIDGQNAEYCAPLFHRAREHNQKFRANASLSREEKQEALMLAETMWREALAQCKGNAAKESAANNANALARERATPFVARPIPGPSLAPPPKVASTPPPTSPPKVAASTTSPSVAALAAPVLPATTNTLSGSALASAFATAFPSLPKPASTTAEPAAAAPAPKPIPLATADVQPEDFTAGGMRFTGKFVREADGGTVTGTGKLTWANGDTYDGTLRKGQRHGKGLFIWANGQRYDGQWIDDHPTGQTDMLFANGNRYEGTVSDGAPQGAGRMAYASGDSYLGDFKSGVPHGKGVYIWKNGQQFDGAWVESRPHGQGKLKFAGGDLFEGDLKDGVPDGEGRFTWTNGDQYTGQWKAGKKQGQGTFTWKSGDFWQGVYDNDQQTADGKLVQKAP